MIFIPNIRKIGFKGKNITTNEGGMFYNIKLATSKL